MSFLCLDDKFSQVLQLKSLSYYLQDFVHKVSSGCDQVFCSCFIITSLLSKYCSRKVLPRACEAECPSELILLRTVWFLVIVDVSISLLVISQGHYQLQKVNYILCHVEPSIFMP